MLDRHCDAPPGGSRPCRRSEPRLTLHGPYNDLRPTTRRRHRLRRQPRLANHRVRPRPMPRRHRRSHGRSHGRGRFATRRFNARRMRCRCRCRARSGSLRSSTNGRTVRPAYRGNGAPGRRARRGTSEQTSYPTDGEHTQRFDQRIATHEERRPGHAQIPGQGHHDSGDAQQRRESGKSRDGPCQPMAHRASHGGVVRVVRQDESFEHGARKQHEKEPRPETNRTGTDRRRTPTPNQRDAETPEQGKQPKGGQPEGTEHEGEHA